MVLMLKLTRALGESYKAEQGGLPWAGIEHELFGYTGFSLPWDGLIPGNASLSK